MVLFSALIFQKIRTCIKILLTDVNQIFDYGDKVNLKKFSYGSCFMFCPSVVLIRADLSLYLHCPEDFLTPEQIEGYLSEKVINGILNDSGKPGSESIIVQMA